MTLTPKEEAENLWLTYFELLPDGFYSDAAAKEEAKKLALVMINKLIEQNGEIYLSNLGDKANEYYIKQNGKLFQIKEELQKI